MTVSNIKKLTSVPPPPKKTITYIECLEAHIAELGEEEKNAEVDMVVVVGHSKNGGCFYSPLEGDSIIKAIGLLEVTKLYILDGEE